MGLYTRNTTCFNVSEEIFQLVRVEIKEDTWFQRHDHFSGGGTNRTSKYFSIKSVIENLQIGTELHKEILEIASGERFVELKALEE